MTPTSSRTPTTRRVALAVLAALAAAGAIIWWILSTIEPATYLAINDELTTISDWLLWASAIAQTAFVLLWLSLPWYSHWVGRALMVKSIALATYLDVAVIFSHIDPFAALPTLAVVLFGFITLGIVSQLGVLLYEMTPHGRGHRAAASEKRHQEQHRTQGD